MEQTFVLPVSNMTCGGCAARVTRALSGIVGASGVSVNLANETAQLTVPNFDVVQNAVSALSDAGYPARKETLRLMISDMSCASCVTRLERGLRAAPGVVDAQVNLADDTAIVQFLPGVTTARDVAALSGRLGYPAKPADNAIVAQNTVPQDTHRRAAFLAAALTLPVFVLEMGAHLFPAWHHLIVRTIGLQSSWIIQFLLTSLVLLGPGRQFFTSGIPALLRRAPTMNTLAALGAGSAWAFSTVALFAPAVLPQGSQAVYFEAAALIVTLILMGRWFEARAKNQTGAAIRSLIALQPHTARVAQGEDWVDVPVEALALGDRFMLKPGERVPTDAIVISGAGRVDESMLTGEPMQVSKAPGDALTGGTVNGHGPLICEVAKIGQDTTLAHIIRMVQEAQGARLPIQALVDQVTLWFVPAVMLIAVLTVMVWLIFGPDPVLSHALVAGVAVLIIACPCAMGLATPTSIMVGTGRAASLGVLFRQGDALQALSSVQLVAFDKTGTLTQGKPVLTTFDSIDAGNTDEVLRRIAAIEAQSEHPVAHAVMSAAIDKGLTLPAVADAKTLPGYGITGTVEGVKLSVGNAALMASEGIDLSAHTDRATKLEDAGNTVFFAASDGQFSALLAVSDPIRPTSVAAIAALKARGLKVAMISGDAAGTARAVGHALGIGEVRAEVLPAQKIAALQDLRAAHGRVAFVGDGINDAPALAEADVGIAIGTGTDVAIELADVVLMSGDVQGVTKAFDLSRLTLRNIRQNLIWAFGYNAALIPVAAGALYPFSGLMLSPALAAGAMACSSVFVLGNALRLRRMRMG